MMMMTMMMNASSSSQITMSDGKTKQLAYVNDECKGCGWNDLNLGIPGENDVIQYKQSAPAFLLTSPLTTNQPTSIIIIIIISHRIMSPGVLCLVMSEGQYCISSRIPTIIISSFNQDWW